MPLVYNSLESEHAEVQEKGLRAIPGLLDILDVSSVQEILFVKVAVRSNRQLDLGHCYREDTKAFCDLSDPLHKDAHSLNQNRHAGCLP